MEWLLFEGCAFRFLELRRADADQSADGNSTQSADTRVMDDRQTAEYRQFISAAWAQAVNLKKGENLPPTIFIVSVDKNGYKHEEPLYFLRHKNNKRYDISNIEIIGKGGGNPTGPASTEQRSAAATSAIPTDTLNITPSAEKSSCNAGVPDTKT